MLKAWQAKDNSVKVLCSIDQKTDLADHVRQNVLNRQLPDLSLSHSYEMFLDGMSSKIKKSTSNTTTQEIIKLL